MFFSINSYIIIKYLVCFLLLIYILQQFIQIIQIKISVFFDDFEQFTKYMVNLINWQIRIENKYSYQNINNNLLFLLQTDILSMIRVINKGSTKDNYVHITQVKNTLIKAKKVKKIVLVKNQTSSSSKSPYFRSPLELSPLI